MWRERTTLLGWGLGGLWMEAGAPGYRSFFSLPFRPLGSPAPLDTGGSCTPLNSWDCGTPLNSSASGGELLPGPVGGAVKLALGGIEHLLNEGPGIGPRGVSLLPAAQAQAWDQDPPLRGPGHTPGPHPSKV